MAPLHRSIVLACIFFFLCSCASHNKCYYDILVWDNYFNEPISDIEVELDTLKGRKPLLISVDHNGRFLIPCKILSRPYRIKISSNSYHRAIICTNNKNEFNAPPKVIYLVPGHIELPNRYPRKPSSSSQSLYPRLVDDDLDAFPLERKRLPAAPSSEHSKD